LLNNKTVDFAYTDFNAEPNEPIENIKSEHVLVVNDKMWKIRYDKQRMTVKGINGTFNSEAIGVKYYYSGFKTAVKLLDVNRRNLVVNNIHVLFNV